MSWLISAALLFAAFPVHAQVKLSGIGDSISQGFDANCIPDWTGNICRDDPANAFGQGTHTEWFSSERIPYSVYQRWNFSQKQFASASGARMIYQDASSPPNAASQARSICAQTTRPDHVILLLGGNDVCDASSISNIPDPTTFGNALGAAFDILGGCLAPNASVIALSVPRVDTLKPAGVQRGCNNNWCLYSLFTGSCTCNVVTSESSTTNLNLIGSKIDAWNAELKNRVAAANSKWSARAIHYLTDWQGPRSAGAQYVNTSLGTYAFKANDISYDDCFHPHNDTGQCKLACITYEQWRHQYSSASTAQAALGPCFVDSDSSDAAGHNCTTTW